MREDHLAIKIAIKTATLFFSLLCIFGDFELQFQAAARFGPLVSVWLCAEEGTSGSAGMACVIGRAYLA